jgi:hypothetical protein
VLALFLAFFGALAWGVGRIGRAGSAGVSPRQPPTSAPPAREREREPAPA